MTKAQALEKMNRRHGTDIADYFMMAVWLRRAAERCARKGPPYADQAREYREDYQALLGAE